MKTFLKQKINLASVAMIVLILTCGVGIVSASYVPPGSTASSLIHRGGGEQAMSSLSIGGAGLGEFSTRGVSGSVAFFSQTNHNAFFRSLEELYALNRLFIGAGKNTANKTVTASPEIAIWKNPQGLSQLTAQLQRVNVAGNVRANNLTHSKPTANVCVDRSGIIRLCPQPDPIDGVCGSAENSSHINPPTTNLCSSGTASPVTTHPNQFTWNCYGQNGGAMAQCSAPRTVQDTYHWHEGPWSECNSTGSCGGTPLNTVGAKIDWEGNPFDWEDGSLYVSDRRIRAACTPWTGQSEFNSVVGRSFDYNASGTGGQACVTQMYPEEGNYSWRGNNSSPSYPGYVYYEANVALGYWEKITVRGGPVGMNASEILSVSVDYSMPLYETGKMYRSICGVTGQGQYPSNNEQFCDQTSSDPKQKGEWVYMGHWCSPYRDGARNNLPTDPRINRLNRPYNSSQFYMDYGGNTYPAVSGYACVPTAGGSCNGTTQQSCIAKPGCLWSTGGGTQTRTVACHNQNHVLQPEQLCITHVGPKPATTRACS